MNVSSEGKQRSLRQEQAKRQKAQFLASREIEMRMLRCEKAKQQQEEFRAQRSLTPEEMEAHRSVMRKEKGKKQQADAHYSRIQLRIQTVNRKLERTLNDSYLQEKFCESCIATWHNQD